MGRLGVAAAVVDDGSSGIVATFFNGIDNNFPRFDLIPFGAKPVCANEVVHERKPHALCARVVIFVNLRGQCFGAKAKPVAVNVIPEEAGCLHKTGRQSDAGNEA